MKNKNFLKCFFSIPLFLFFHLQEILTREIDNSIIPSKYLEGLIFDIETVYEKKQIIVAMNYLFIIIVFHLLFGNFFYKFFVKGTSFYFSRINKRKKWIWKKTAQLYIYCILYVTTYLLMASAYTFFQKGYVDITIQFVMEFLQILFVLVFIIGLSTFTINCISIFLSSNIGFLVTYCIILLLLGISIHYDTIIGNPKLIYGNLLNPMSSMTLVTYNKPIIISLSILYDILLSITIIAAFAEIVETIDIMGKNKEVM